MGLDHHLQLARQAYDSPLNSGLSCQCRWWLDALTHDCLECCFGTAFALLLARYNVYALVQRCYEDIGRMPMQT